MKTLFNLNPTIPNQNDPFLEILSPQGAEIILGDTPADSLAIPLEPSAKSLFGPRGACLVSPNGPLWVADTGHHRLLGWRNRPQVDGQPADWIIGQPDFNHEGQNAKGQPTANTLSVPTGICLCGEGLAVADAWNHRVLIWKEIPRDSHVPADIVLGQADFNQNQPNRGYQETGSDRLHWPYGILYHQGQLWVADSGNRRVLVWNQLPTTNGQPADWVLGQKDLNSRDENGGETANGRSMRWPHSLAVWEDNLSIADAGNNRVMIWEGIPTENNSPCSMVLGQNNFEMTELNRGQYFPTSNSLSMPYGIAVAYKWLIVADTANSRLLGWKGKLSMGCSAQGLTAQSHFRSKSENRSYSKATRQSLCWPYGIQICGNTAVIADSGNNRVLLWSVNNNNE
ncbi:NHL repeat containing protein [Gloeothece citriformis PCC 7424]|uniref:NHL repeat containing protein n=1 Tax=Gloeothece citriformis (strain PCC 7424) TaxID=65393 RepID=B7KCD9_GLOC7|nr:hypothetical protein [Gloeothece citriformis]ACK70244.1 NHL repeat containing protein [Gloeothece citriformis PCC 7424]